MKIYTVTRHFMREVQSLFPSHEVEILPKDFSKVSADLIVFTGGEDVNPSLYHSNENKGWGENPRDLWELEVLRAIRRNRLHTKKTLGICRGVQLMNVGFGGTLVFDIQTKYGRPHAPVHPISWQCDNPFVGTFNMVNSLHHQCIEAFGDSMPFRILGIEPSTSTTEVISWNDAFLGFQSHPELLPDTNPIKAMIAEIIERWVNGNVSMSSSSGKRVKLDWSFSNSSQYNSGDE